MWETLVGAVYLLLTVPIVVFGYQLFRYVEDWPTKIGVVFQTLALIFVLAGLGISIMNHAATKSDTQWYQGRVVNLLEDIKRLDALRDGIEARPPQVIGDTASVWILSVSDEWKLKRGEGLCMWTNPTGRFTRLVKSEECPPPPDER